jgi:O-antigen ligase
VSIASDRLGHVDALLAFGAAIVSLLRPAWSVAVVAACLPFVTILHRASDSAGEAVGLVAAATVCGALLRLGATTDRGARWPAVGAFAAVIVVSHANALRTHWPDLDRSVLGTGEPALVWLIGLGLAVIAARIARQHRRLGEAAARTLIVGASLVALASLVEVAGIAAGAAHPIGAAIETMFTARISPVFPDPNAAGSYFALLAVAAAVLWLTLARANQKVARANLKVRPTYGRPWLPWLLLLALGLWLTGSRTAMASAVSALLAAWVLMVRPRLRAVVAAALASAVVVTYLVMAPPARQPQATSAYAARVRVDMARVALTMARQHPLLGVGPGNFQTASRPFISPELAAMFPPAASGENAHNQFLQVLAELGVPGLVAFVAVLLTPFRSSWRALRPRGGSVEGLALCAGTMALLISGLAGHPLLSPPVTLSFMLALGLTAGLTSAPPVTPDDFSDAAARRLV